MDKQRKMHCQRFSESFSAAVGIIVLKFLIIYHEDKLICITALILTGLIITTKFIALLNANYHWDDPHPFNNAIYHRRPRPDNH